MTTEATRNQARSRIANRTIREKPILFSGPMVRAILNGRKTQTRRIVKPQPTDETVGWWCTISSTEKSRVGLWTPRNGKTDYRNLKDTGDSVKCPFGKPGMVLWVRETFDIESFGAGVAQIRYRADNARGRNCGVSDRKLPDRCGCVPSIHMPRHCSRINLEITDVRVERLNEISEEDALAEGISFQCFDNDCNVIRHAVWPNEPSLNDRANARETFRDLWESINGPGSWDLNPWVWVVEWPRLEVTA